MNWGRVYVGGLVVAAGVILLLDNMGNLDAGEVFSTWWPVAIIGAGLLTLASNPHHWPVSVLITLVGVALLLSTLDVVDLWSVILPGLAILVGLFIIFGRSLAPRTEVGDRISNFNMFSGSQLASHSSQFSGGSVSTVFGGTEIDLRDAAPTPGASLDLLALFGGIEVKVPEGWNVQTQGMPLFGGIDNVTVKDQLPADAPELTIHYTALFGGIEIKH